MRIRQKKVGVAYWAKVRKDVIFIPSSARDEERFRQNVCDHVSTILQFCKQKSLFFLVQDSSLCLFLAKKWEMTRKYVQVGGSAVANCGTEGDPHWYIRTLKDPQRYPNQCSFSFSYDCRIHFPMGNAIFVGQHFITFKNIKGTTDHIL